MGRLISNMLVGAGSILKLMPPEPHPFRFRVKTADEAIREAWQRVGISLWQAIDSVDQSIEDDATHGTADRATTTDKP